MSIIEVILLVIGLVALIIAFFAHKDHLSFKDEATKDIALVEATAKADLALIEDRLRKVEAQIVATVSPAPAAAQVALPAAG